jgi:hypothetical protein
MNEKDIEWMELYLMGGMNAQQKVEFEKELEVRPELRKGLEQYRELVAGIRQSGRNRLKAHLKELDSGQAVRDSRWYLRIAAGLVVIAVAAVYLLLRPGRPEDLYVAYYEPLENFSPSSSRGNTPEELLAEAWDEYTARKYEEVLVTLTAAPDTVDEAVLLLSGLAEMELGRFAPATQNFDAIAYQGGTLVEPALWYLALCQIRNGLPGEAKVSLRQLLPYRGAYETRARELLDKLP